MIKNSISDIEKTLKSSLIEIKLIISDIIKLTERHTVAIPEPGLWKSADDETKKHSVRLHYEFLRLLSEKISLLDRKKADLFALFPILDEMSAGCLLEELEMLSEIGKKMLETQKRLDELERVSGRFVSSLDKFSDALHKADNADFAAEKRACREYFEFVTGICIYIDNLNNI